MKVIIAGSRSITNKEDLEIAIERSLFNITEVVSGLAKGIDHLGIMWAKKHKVPVKKFPARFAEYGLRAGLERNLEMADYADALIAVCDNTTIGTQTDHLLKTMQQRYGKPTYVHYVR